MYTHNTMSSWMPCRHRLSTVSAKRDGARRYWFYDTDVNSGRIDSADNKKNQLKTSLDEISGWVFYESDNISLQPIGITVD